MLTDQEFAKLTQRVADGKKWIVEHGGWDGGTTPAFDYTRHQPQTRLQVAIAAWFKMSNECLNEAIERNVFEKASMAFKKGEHSKPWLEMKQRDAIAKWKRTYPKEKRGPDPRPLSLEAFDDGIGS